MANFHITYRPVEFDQVLGQTHVTKALQHFEKTKDWPHAFLLTGMAGCGKTTISRIIANKIGASEDGIVEVDAAMFNGVDTMRSLLDGIQYRNLGDSDIKFIILDECHMFSKAAWNALLKSVEEPPKHVYFAFCTTDVEKVPTTIASRCTRLTLKSVGYSDILELLSAVREIEQLPIPVKGLQLIAQRANGSPRFALTALNLCGHYSSTDEISTAIEAVDENRDVIELCRLLTGKVAVTWKKAMVIVKNLKEQNPESVRLVIVNYVAAALLNTDSEDQAQRLLAILDAFSKPCHPSEKFAPILLAIGTLLF